MEKEKQIHGGPEIRGMVKEERELLQKTQERNVAEEVKRERKKKRKLKQALKSVRRELGKTGKDYVKNIKISENHVGKKSIE